MTKEMKDTDFIKLPLFVRGKVRNVYDLGDTLLIVVTDRISAFVDVEIGCGWRISNGQPRT